MVIDEEGKHMMLLASGQSDFQHAFGGAFGQSHTILLANNRAKAAGFILTQ